MVWSQSFEVVERADWQPVWQTSALDFEVEGPELWVRQDQALLVHSLTEGTERTLPAVPELWTRGPYQAKERRLTGPRGSHALPARVTCLEAHRSGLLAVGLEGNKLAWLQNDRLRVLSLDLPRGARIQQLQWLGADDWMLWAGWGRCANGCYRVRSGQSRLVPWSIAEDNDEGSARSLWVSGNASFGLEKWVTPPGDGQASLFSWPSPENRQEVLNFVGESSQQLRGCVASSGPWLAFCPGDHLQLLHMPSRKGLRFSVAARQLGFGARHQLAALGEDGILRIYRLPERL